MGLTAGSSPSRTRSPAPVQRCDRGDERWTRRQETRRPRSLPQLVAMSTRTRLDILRTTFTTETTTKSHLHALESTKEQKGREPTRTKSREDSSVSDAWSPDQCSSRRCSRRSTKSLRAPCPTRHIRGGTAQRRGNVVNMSAERSSIGPEKEGGKKVVCTHSRAQSSFSHAIICVIFATTITAQAQASVPSNCRGTRFELQIIVDGTHLAERDPVAVTIDRLVWIDCIRASEGGDAVAMMDRS